MQRPRTRNPLADQSERFEDPDHLNFVMEWTVCHAPEQPLTHDQQATIENPYADKSSDLQIPREYEPNLWTEVHVPVQGSI